MCVRGKERESVHVYSWRTFPHTQKQHVKKNKLFRANVNQFLCIDSASHPSRLFPPAAADRRQLLRSGLQPASRGNQHDRGNPALHRQRRRHDLGGGVRLPQQHGGFCRHAQRKTEKGKLLPVDIEFFSFNSFFCHLLCRCLGPSLQSVVASYF